MSDTTDEQFEEALLLGQLPALQARQITEELLEDLKEYATWLRMMDDPYSRQAVARDLTAMVGHYTAILNGQPAPVPASGVWPGWWATR